MGGLASLADTLANLAKRAGLAADEMDRTTEAAGRLPSDVSTPTPSRGSGIVEDALPPQIRATFAGIGSSGRKIGQAIDEATDGADDLRDGMAEAEELFRSSSMGQVLEKVLSGYGIGTAEGGEAFSAIGLIERYIANRAELESGRASADRQFVLRDSLAKQAALFQRFFGPALGQIDTVARELQKFRQMFPDYGEGSGGGGGGSSLKSTPSSGTLGKSKPESCQPASSLSILQRAGALR